MIIAHLSLVPWLHRQYVQLKGVMMENESIRKQIENESEIQFELNLPSELPVKMDSFIQLD